MRFRRLLTAAALLGAPLLPTGGCSSDTAPAETGCALSSDCATGLVCLFRSCTQMCRLDRDCPAGERCLPTDGFAGCVTPAASRCEATCPGGTSCGKDDRCRATCDPKATCLADQVCSDGSCVGTDASRDPGATLSAGGTGGGGGTGTAGVSGQGGGAGTSAGGAAGSGGGPGTGGGGVAGVGGTAGSGGASGNTGGGAAGIGGAAGAAGASGVGGSGGDSAGGSAGTAGSGGGAVGGAAGAGGSGGDAAGGATCMLGGLAGMSPGGTFVATAPMPKPHAQGFVEWLPAEGKVLLVGGFDGDNVASFDTELFDVATSTWESLGNQAFQSAYHVRLDDGRVVAGSSYANAPQIFDPKTKAWSSLPLQLGDLTGSSAILLAGGGVLVAGAAEPEIYDPAGKTWTKTSPMLKPRDSPLLFNLPGGKVLAIGSGDTVASCYADTEIFDPTDGSWTPGPTMKSPGFPAGAALLPNGDVLVLEGSTCDGTTVSTTEILKGGAAGAFVSGPTLPTLTDTPIVTTLSSGKVLVVGGYSNVTAISNTSAQVFDPAANAGSGAFFDLGPMLAPRYTPQVASLGDGRALIAGGIVLTGMGGCVAYETSAELCSP